MSDFPLEYKKGTGDLALTARGLSAYRSKERNGDKNGAKGRGNPREVVRHPPGLRPRGSECYVTPLRIKTIWQKGDREN